MREQLKDPLAKVLANYEPLQNDEAYPSVFTETVNAYFHENNVDRVANFLNYMRVVTGNPNIAKADVTSAHYESFLLILLKRLNAGGAFKQQGSESKGVIETAITKELELASNITPIKAELLICSFNNAKSIDLAYSATFTNTLTAYLEDADNADKLNNYFKTNASLLTTDHENVPAMIDGQPNPALVKKLIRHVLARLNTQNQIQFLEDPAIAADYAENCIQEAIQQELSWSEAWKQELVRANAIANNHANHIKPEKQFKKGLYVLEEAVLGYSTYGLDDAVTAADRPVKNIAYGEGDPLVDPANTTGHIKNAFEVHTNLMYAYFGVTLLSFLLLPAKFLYVWLRYGKDDIEVDGEKKKGLKSLLTDKDTYVELAINTVIATLTGIAVLATTFITWPVVIALFTVGLFAAIYFGRATKLGQKANLEKLYEKNQEIIKCKQEISDKKIALQKALLLVLANSNANPVELNAKVNQLKQDIDACTLRLEAAREASHELYVTQEYANSFFGKSGVYVKIGISAATVIAYTLLATAIFSASAVFLPSLIVMSVLGAAALTYFIIKQVRAYQLAKELKAAHQVTDEQINTLVRGSDKKILAELDAKNVVPAGGGPLPEVAPRSPVMRRRPSQLQDGLFGGRGEERQPLLGENEVEEQSSPREKRRGSVSDQRVFGRVSLDVPIPPVVEHKGGNCTIL